MSLESAIRETVVEAVAEALEPLVEVLSKIDREPAPLVYTAAEAGRVLGVSGQTVNRWLDKGELQRLPHVDKVLIPRASVEAFVSRSMDGSAA